VTHLLFKLHPDNVSKIDHVMLTNEQSESIMQIIGLKSERTFQVYLGVDTTGGEVFALYEILHDELDSHNVSNIGDVIKPVF